VVTTDDFTVQQHPLPPGFLPWDIWTDNQNLYVLTASQTNDQDAPYTILVLSTTNLVHWHEAFLFHADTFARSFLSLDDVFYFGLGSNTDALSPATGDILKLRRSCW
jgi:hypothetical protein